MMQSPGCLEMARRRMSAAFVTLAEPVMLVRFSFLVSGRLMVANVS